MEQQMMTTADRRDLRGVFVRYGIASIAALFGWEVFGRLVAPLWLGEVLDPAGLVMAAFGIENDTLAHVIHAFTGLIVFPLAYALVVCPGLNRVAPTLPGWLIGLGYGVVL